MTDTILLVPSDLALPWRQVSDSLPEPVFRGVAEREEELVDVGALALVGLQITGYVADVSAVTLLLLSSVRKLLDRRGSETGDPRLPLRRRDGDEAAFWVVLDGEMSDQELCAQIERLIQVRAGNGQRTDDHERADDEERPDDEGQAPR